MRQETLLKYLLEDVLKKTDMNITEELLNKVDTESDPVEIFQKPIKITDTEYIVKKEHLNMFQCYFEIKFEDELNTGKTIGIHELHNDVYRVILEDGSLSRIIENNKIEEKMGLETPKDKIIADNGSADAASKVDGQVGFENEYLQNILNNAKSKAPSVPSEAFQEKQPTKITLPEVDVEGEGTGVESTETLEDIIGGSGVPTNQHNLEGWVEKEKDSFENLPDDPINLGPTGTTSVGPLSGIAPKSGEPAEFNIRQLVINTEKDTQPPVAEGQTIQTQNQTPPVPPVSEEYAYRIYIGKGAEFAGFNLNIDPNLRAQDITTAMGSAFMNGEDVCIPINSAADFLTLGAIPLQVTDQALLTKIADGELGEKPCLKLELNNGVYNIANVK